MPVHIYLSDFPKGTKILIRRFDQFSGTLRKFYLNKNVTTNILTSNESVQLTIAPSANFPQNELYMHIINKHSVPTYPIIQLYKLCASQGRKTLLFTECQIY